MTASKTRLPTKGLRTLAEVRTSIPIGGSCWIIHSDPWTKEPLQIQKFVRANASDFMSGPSDDEDPMPTYMTIDQILKRPYGGAWLKRSDAQKYLSLLKKLWKDAPRTIDALAQELEKKTVH